MSCFVLIHLLTLANEDAAPTDKLPLMFKSGISKRTVWQKQDTKCHKCQSNWAELQVKGAPTNNKQSDGRRSVQERETRTKERKCSSKKAYSWNQESTSWT